MPDCLCASVPRARLGEMRNAGNVLVSQFHLDCPDHGIIVLGDKPMNKVFKRAYLTRDQLVGLRVNHPARVMEKHPNRTHALIEWVDYEFIKEEEDQGGSEPSEGAVAVDEGEGAVRSET